MNFYDILLIACAIINKLKISKEKSDILLEKFLTDFKINIP